MSLISIKNVGKAGVNYDLPPQDIDAGAWSRTRNARFRNGCFGPSPGNWPVYGDITAADTLLSLFNIPVPNDTPRWVVAGLAKLFATNGTSDFLDVSRAVGGAYNANSIIGWNGGVLGGIPIINNGVDVPQAWLTPGAGLFVDLPNWPATDRARVIRTFRQFAVALDITKPGGRFGSLVKWSTLADPGFVPSTWDPADPTALAGEVPLSDTPDDLIDCLPLRGVNILYKQQSVHTMQFTQGFDVFKFDQLFKDFGLLAVDCVKEVNGRHVLLSGDDLIMHDGNQWDSIANKRVRDWFFRNMDPSLYYMAYVAVNYQAGEVLFCFPMIGSATVNMALVWNWRENTFSTVELPDFVAMETGFVPGSSVRQFGFGGIQWDQIVEQWAELTGSWGDFQGFGGSGGGDTPTDTTWDQSHGTWDSDTDPWDSVLDTPTKRTLVGLRDSITFPLHMLDIGTRSMGVEIETEVERVALGIEGQDIRQEMVVDLGSVKLVRAVYLQFQSVPENEIDVYVGSQMTLQGNVDWGLPFTIDESSDFKFNCTVNTRLLAIKFRSRGDAIWRLSTITLDVDKVSRF